jgi:hypothetical protein
MNAVRACALAFCGTSFASGLCAGGVFAADGIDVRRGVDTMVFGSCVPALVAENRSTETVDYLQVDLAITLANGQERTVELQSAYREGVLYPIPPGATATLKQHLDTSRSLGVGCDDITVRRVLQTICEAAEKPCAAPVRVQP